MDGFGAGNMWCRRSRMEEGKRGRCEDGVAVSAKEGGNSEEIVFEDVVGACVVCGGDRGEGNSATGGGGYGAAAGLGEGDGRHIMGGTEVGHGGKCGGAEKDYRSSAVAHCG